MPTKLWFITKFETHALEKTIFKSNKVKITNSGERHLGSVLGTVTFNKQCIHEIVSQCISEMEALR